MATLPTKSFSQIVTDTISGIQGRASKPLNFSTGSTLRAIAEGFAGLYLWFQAIVLQVLAVTRLSTSSGTDVDTFTADFMPPVAGTASPRLGAQAASGEVTFSRFTAGPSSCFIPVGATVKTGDGSNIEFSVVANASYATFSSLLQGYTLPSSVASIVVPVKASVAGASGNVLAGAISSITSPIQGIDAVINAAKYTNGADQEGDSALKKRFSDYILGLSRGDYYGLAASVEGSAPSVQWVLTEGYNYDGSYRPGYFFVVSDDGSGSPTAVFQATVLAAAQAVRPLGIQCQVFNPIVFLANVSMQIKSAQGYDHNVVVAQVVAAVSFGINSLGLGNDLPWTLLSSLAYSVPGVVQVSNVLLNSVTGDAANISTSKLSNDGKYTIRYATIKAGKMIIS